jgi:hypothetical protein
VHDSFYEPRGNLWRRLLLAQAKRPSDIDELVDDRMSSVAVALHPVGGRAAQPTGSGSGARGPDRRCRIPWQRHSRRPLMLLDRSTTLARADAAAAFGHSSASKRGSFQLAPAQRRCSGRTPSPPPDLAANCDARSAKATLPRFAQATGMSALPLVPRATLSRARGLTLASRPRDKGSSRVCSWSRTTGSIRSSHRNRGRRPLDYERRRMLPRG